MARSPEEALALYRQREKMYAPLHAAMVEISDIYAGRTKVELPEADEADPAAVPNLLGQGLDQMAGRVASVNPMWLFAAEDPTIERDVKRAQQAAKALGAWYVLDRMPLKMRQRARHLLAYALSPTVLRWDDYNHRPVREVRSPLETFPSPETVHGTALPTDCLFSFRRSVGWLVAKGYEPQVRYLTDNQRELDMNNQMQLLEYIDVDGRMLALVGWGGSMDPYLPIDPFVPVGAQRAALLTFSPSVGRYDAPMVSVPTRLTLDKPMGQFDTITSTYYRQAKILALELAAIEKGIFPDTYLESNPGQQAHFLDGPHDGRTGLVNIIANGQVKELTSNPGYQTPSVRDYLERNMRVTAGIPAEFGGESGSNIRTARRGDSVMASVIDFPLAEAQDIFSYALADEDKCMIALAKAYDGSARRTFYVGVGNSMRPVTFVADEVFTHDEHTVTYPLSGTDINTLRVGLGQARGMGTMSTRTAMELDPMVADPEVEHDRIQGEGMEQALMSSIQQGLASGAIAPLVGARIYELVVSDKLEIFDALQKATAEAQAQTQTPPVPGQPPTPDQVAAPGAVQALAGGPAPSVGQVGLAQLLRTLHTPQTAAGAVP